MVAHGREESWQVRANLMLLAGRYERLIGVKIGILLVAVLLLVVGLLVLVQLMRQLFRLLVEMLRVLPVRIDISSLRLARRIGARLAGAAVRQEGRVVLDHTRVERLARPSPVRVVAGGHHERQLAELRLHLHHQLLDFRLAVAVQAVVADDREHRRIRGGTREPAARRERVGTQRQIAHAVVLTRVRRARRVRVRVRPRRG